MVYQSWTFPSSSHISSLYSNWIQKKTLPQTVDTVSPDSPLSHTPRVVLKISKKLFGEVRGASQSWNSVLLTIIWLRRINPRPGLQLTCLFAKLDRAISCRDYIKRDNACPVLPLSASQSNSKHLKLSPISSELQICPHYFWILLLTFYRD